jgi:hypothetical protein
VTLFETFFRQTLKQNAHETANNNLIRVYYINLIWFGISEFIRLDADKIRNLKKCVVALRNRIGMVMWTAKAIQYNCRRHVNQGILNRKIFCIVFLYDIFSTCIPGALA